MKYLYMIALLIIGLNIGYAIGHWNGFTDGKASVRVKNLEKAVEINEKKAIIRNNRLNSAGVVKRMRSGTF